MFTVLLTIASGRHSPEPAPVHSFHSQGERAATPVALGIAMGVTGLRIDDLRSADRTAVNVDALSFGRAKNKRESFYVQHQHAWGE